MTTSPRFVRFSLILSVSIVLFEALAALGQDPAPAVNVWTWQNDNGRTGQNAAETILTTGNVNKLNFGQLCSYPVDSQVYAQPRTVSSVHVGGQYHKHGAAYVATQSDTLEVSQIVQGFCHNLLF